MTPSPLSEPRKDLKYIFLALFVCLAIAAFLEIGAAGFLQSAPSLDLGAGSQVVSASTHFVVEIPEVRIPMSPYIIVEPADQVRSFSDSPYIVLEPYVRH